MTRELPNPSGSVADVEVVGELTHLEALHLEQAGTPASFAFLSSLEACSRWRSKVRARPKEPSIAALLPLRRLQTLTLGAERGELRDLQDLALLGEMDSLASFRMYGGPKQIASIKWIKALRQLESFDMYGTAIADGDLTPLLESGSLRRIRLNPVRKRYSHSEAEVYAFLRAKAALREHAADETT